MNKGVQLIQSPMWFSKYATEAVQRIACHFKPHTYFLHTMSPLPSILIPVPNRMNVINPLLNSLVNQENFNLNDRLKDLKVAFEQEPKQSKKAAYETSFTSIYGLAFDERTSFICSNEEGKIEISKNSANHKSIIGVILYSTVQTEQVKVLSSRNYQNLIITFKVLALISIVCVIREFQFSTRLQNHKKRS